MARKNPTDEEIVELLQKLDEETVDSEEEIVPHEDSEPEDRMPIDESDSASSSLNSEEESAEFEDDYITSRDGTKWTKNPPRNKGRIPRRNILRIVPGHTNYSKNIATPLNAFQLLFDDAILDIIMKCSEKKAAQLNHPEWRLPKELLNAFIGMLILFGATRGRKEAISCVWNEDTALSRPIFKATMSRNVFKDILRFIRTDDHETRQLRRATDKLAAIREVWEIFTKNCQNCLVPESQMCVDEQLVGFRGR